MREYKLKPDGLVTNQLLNHEKSLRKEMSALRNSCKNVQLVSNDMFDHLRTTEDDSRLEIEGMSPIVASPNGHKQGQILFTPRLVE